MSAKQDIESAALFPFDGGEEFWDGDGNSPPPPAKDKAHATARGILHNLCDRRGVKHELDSIDHDIREELTENLAEIIRVGMA